VNPCCRAFATAEDLDLASNTQYRKALEGLSGGHILHESLVANEVDTVFGYAGGANLPVLDTFHNSAIQFVMNRSEQCCGHAAQGYAKATGKCGVILTTSGPGLTNIITPLQDAKGDSVPLVALSGQVPTGAVGTDAFQECAAVELTRPCTKWSYQITSVEEIPAVVHEAFHVAMSGKRGPVHLDLPKDIMTTILNTSDVLMSTSDQLHQIPPDQNTIQAVADLISKSSRPIIYAGQGVIDCHETLRELAIKANIPVTTTLHAMGAFDETHPLSLHMLGMHGAVYANYAIQNADLIIAIGSRFDDRTTGNISQYAPEALKAEAAGKGGIIHFDIEPTQFGRVISPTIAVEGDCADGMKALIPLMEVLNRLNSAPFEIPPPLPFESALFSFASFRQYRGRSTPLG
jgi:acetolactate synthase-1/2/3 large subunit